MTPDIRTAAEDAMIRANAVEPLVVVDGEEAVMQLTEYGNGFIAGAVWAAALALEEAADDIESRRNEPGLVHLDLRYAGYYTGIRSGMESDSKALRARAAEIREGKNDE